MKKTILILALICIAFGYGQEEKNFKDFDFRLNNSFGLSFNSDWFTNKPSLFVKTGFGFKMNKNFWLNADIFAMRYATDRNEPDIEYYTNWTFAPNVSKDFNLNSKLKVVGSVGLFVTYETYSDDFTDTITNDFTGETFTRRFFKEESRVDVGVILGAKVLYAIKENLLVGLDFTGYAYYYLFLDNFLIGPTIEFRL